MQRVLITGANRGIGLAFARHYAEAGAQVFAACRTPENADELGALAAQHTVHVTKLDVSDETSIQEARTKVAEQTDGLDLLVNNAAVFHNTPFGELTFDTSLHTLRVNAVAPLLVTQAFFDLLKRGEQATILNVSSNRASISEKTDTKLIDYSASKAALNMYTRSIAAVAREHGMLAVMIDPGWVQTRMGGEEAALSPDETVAGMVRVLENLTPAQNGGFFNWDGTTHAW